MLVSLDRLPNETRISGYTNKQTFGITLIGKSTKNSINAVSQFRSFLTLKKINMNYSEIKLRTHKFNACLTVAEIFYGCKHRMLVITICFEYRKLVITVCF